MQCPVFISTSPSSLSGTYREVLCLAMGFKGFLNLVFIGILTSSSSQHMRDSAETPCVVPAIRVSCWDEKRCELRWMAAVFGKACSEKGSSRACLNFYVAWLSHYENATWESSINLFCFYFMRIAGAAGTTSATTAVDRASATASTGKTGSADMQYVASPSPNFKLLFVATN
eukprot:IDg1976t1